MFLFGYAITGDDIIFGYYPWAANPPAGYAGPSNPVIDDGTRVLRPWAEFASQSIREGKLPLWNPFMGAGAPFFGNIITAVFYPLHFLYYLDVPLGRTLGAILTLLLPGAFMYIWMLERKTGVFPALVSSVAFMLSGAVVLWITFDLSLIWAPLAFYLTDRLVKTPKASSICGLATVVLIELLSGPEWEIVAFIAQISYLVFLLAIESTGEIGTIHRTKSFLASAGAYCLGFAAASVQLLPSVEYLLESEVWISRSSRPVATFLQPSYLATAVFSDFFGNPVIGSRNWFGPLNYNVINSTYVGPVVLIIGFCSLVFSRRRTRLFFATLAIFSVLFAYAPGFSQLIPFLNMVDPVYVGMLFPLSLAVLAGFGTEGLCRRFRKNTARSSAMWVFVVSVALLLAFVFIKPDIVTFWSPKNPRVEGILGAAILTGTTIGVLALRSAHRIGHRQFQALIFLSLLTSMIPFGMDYNPQIAPGSVYPMPSTPAIQLLTQDRGVFRIMGLGGCCTFPDNIAMSYRLRDVRIYDAFTPQHYGELLRLATDWQATASPITKIKNINLVRLLNVKYIITPPAQDPGIQELVSEGSLTGVYEGKDARVFLVRGYIPAAFIVHQIVIARDSSESLEALASPSFDPATTAVIDEGNTKGFVNFTTTFPSQEQVNIIQYESTSVLIEVTAAKDGYVVLTDNYLPGWRAYVDGNETPILRADQSFRSVFVHEGRHMIRFSYAPESLTIGLCLTLVAFATMLALLGYQLVRSNMAASLELNTSSDGRHERERRETGESAKT